MLLGLECCAVSFRYNTMSIMYQYFGGQGIVDILRHVLVRGGEAFGHRLALPGGLMGRGIDGLLLMRLSILGRLLVPILQLLVPAAPV